MDLSHPLFQVPKVLVLFMLLFYFSCLARYHVERWQEIIGGTTEPEGNVFRYAHAAAAEDFVREIALMLPFPDEQLRMAPPHWVASKETL